MKALGVILLTSLLAVSAPQAEESNSKELVEQLFADCAAVVEDPSYVLRMGSLLDDTAAALTADGNIFSVAGPAKSDQITLPGVKMFNVSVLPGGMSIGCMLSLFGSDLSPEQITLIGDEAAALGQALIGENAVKIGGLVGGPAIFKAPADGVSHIYTWATPDFPPTASVTVTVAPQTSQVAITRFKAAP